MKALPLMFHNWGEDQYEAAIIITFLLKTPLISIQLGFYESISIISIYDRKHVRRMSLAQKFIQSLTTLCAYFIENSYHF